MCVPYWLVYLLHKSLEMRAFLSFREPQITGLAVEIPATNVLACYGVINGSYMVCMNAPLLQSCLTHCESMDCSLPGFSVQGILQAKILEWVAMPSSKGSSQSRDWTCISYLSCIGRLGSLPLAPPGASLSPKLSTWETLILQIWDSRSPFSKSFP